MLRSIVVNDLLSFLTLKLFRVNFVGRVLLFNVVLLLIMLFLVVSGRHLLLVVLSDHIQLVLEVSALHVTRMLAHLAEAGKVGRHVGYTIDALLMVGTDAVLARLLLVEDLLHIVQAIVVARRLGIALLHVSDGALVDLFVQLDTNARRLVLHVASPQLDLLVLRLSCLVLATLLSRSSSHQLLARLNLLLLDVRLMHLL